MNDWRDQVEAFTARLAAAEARAIEEAAERILLSGTNWGIEVHTYLHDHAYTIIAEPSPRVRDIVRHPIVYEPPPTEPPPGWEATDVRID